MVAKIIAIIIMTWREQTSALERMPANSQAYVMTKYTYIITYIKI